MALTTTISGEDSDSYVTVTGYQRYHLNTYDRDISDDDTALTESQIRLATQFLDSSWDWKGIRATSDQSLEWPRSITENILGYLIDSDEIPRRLKKAVYELTYAIREGLDIAPNVETGTVKSQSVAAGSVSSSTTYEQIFLLPKIMMVELLIAPYNNGQLFGTSNGEILRG